MNQPLNQLLRRFESTYAQQPVPRPKILLVDDRQENLVALQRLLRPLEAELFTATSGTKALSLTLRHQFALILLDVQMPDMNGFEVAEFLHGNHSTRSIPIIFITALSKEQRYINKGYEAGAVDYLSKPLDSDILLSKVRVFLELESQTLNLKRALTILSELNQNYRLLLDCAGEAILGFNTEGIISFANPMAYKILAPGGEQLEGRNLTAIFTNQENAPEEQGLDDIRQACASFSRLHNDNATLSKLDGRTFPAQYTVAPYDPELGMAGGVVVIQDITVRKQAEDVLIRMAQFDHLTGLANRKLFLDTLDEALSRAKRHDRQFGVVFLDMDRFKEVNDNLGHLTGDDLLCMFAERLKECVRTEDLVARFGGDEFAILVQDITDASDLEAMVNKIIDCSRIPVETSDHTITMSTSAGVAIYPADGTTPDELMHVADQAMYKAKDQGRDNVRFGSSYHG